MKNNILQTKNKTKYFENFLYSSNEENLISPGLYRINCGIPIIGISSPFENSGS